MSSPGLSPKQVRQFREHGYVLVSGLLDPAVDLAPFEAAYSDLVDAVAPAYLGALDGAPEAEGFTDRPLDERMAILIGASSNRIFDHLEPVLRVADNGFRYQRDLPAAQIPEFFELMRNDKILGVLEPLVGPEIGLAPGYHSTLKLTRSQQELLARAARHAHRSRGRAKAWSRRAEGFHQGTTPWHRDSDVCLQDASKRLVIVWIPLTDADAQSCRLSVHPGSHRDARASAVYGREGSVALTARPGDVVLMHNSLVHGSTETHAAEKSRWANNFRYLPADESAGRPTLPSLVVRSSSQPESELRDAETWAAIWDAALSHVRWYDYPAGRPSKVSMRRARSLTRRWPTVRGGKDVWLQMPAERRLDAVRQIPPAIVDRVFRRLRDRFWD